ncbi:MAG: SDR family oxidoreductase [Candidatus Bipolaricaulota bacterium]|nr:SDR family oxidoreductase [Candidatus Bipolaricaulota bacterium]MBS3792216.1 SDR family oxidoreductase [Candidatus Bipolaricaulota bacterium]
MSETTALVTGAARRIGREIAFSLAEEGVNVVIHYRTSSEEAAELHDKLREVGVGAPLLQADLKDATDLNGLIPEATKKAGKIDYLVNNAAVFPRGSLEELEFAELVDNIRINSWAPFYLARSFVKSHEGGKVVNILDTRVAGYDWDHAGYYFSKVLLARMTKMMALKFAPEFAVNGVAPGLITPPEGLDEEYLRNRTDRVPLKKRGREEDVARAVSYLLKTNFVTGQILYIDGGRNLLHELEG